MIAYTFGQLKLSEVNYLMHDLELGEIVFSLRIWRHYLYGVKGIHASLVFTISIIAKGPKYKVEVLA